MSDSRYAMQHKALLSSQVWVLNLAVHSGSVGLGAELWWCVFLLLLQLSNMTKEKTIERQFDGITPEKLWK